MAIDDVFRPTSWLRVTPLRYIGPFSPFGPWISGVLFAACLMLVVTMVGPPVGYLIRHVVRPELALVSHAIGWWQAVWSA